MFGSEKDQAMETLNQTVVDLHLQNRSLKDEIRDSALQRKGSSMSAKALLAYWVFLVADPIALIFAVSMSGLAVGGLWVVSAGW